jgi:hypothetical protein
VYPVEGRYTMRLTGARCNAVDGCAIGGPVMMLIQPESP